MQLPGDEGLTLIAYSAAPVSPGHDAINLLSTWAATMRSESNKARELPARPRTTYYDSAPLMLVAVSSASDERPLYSSSVMCSPQRVVFEGSSPF